MPRFTAGVVKFQNEVFHEKRELFEHLKNGQKPEALFITCSDSRIETAMITQTDPGALFICRNAGNIVPPHTDQTGGMTASIEFAVAVLQVPHIVICGHTECGAMEGALNPAALKNLPHVRRWLGFAEAAVAATAVLAEDADPKERMRVLLRQNVTLQLQHLRTHPSVFTRLARGDLMLHGWVYDIGTGRVEAWDEASGEFRPVEERYAADVAEHLAHGGCAP